jgi:putative ABC transport system permease protein
MKLKDCLGLSLRDLKKRKGRTFLTSLAVAIGSMLIMIMVGMGTSFQSYIVDILKSQADSTIVAVSPMNYSKEVPKVNTYKEYQKYIDKNFHKITDESLKKIKNIKYVDDIQAYINVDLNSVSIDGKGTKIVRGMGVNLNYDIFSNNNIKYTEKNKNIKNLKPIVAGRTLNKNDENSVIISEDLLKENGIKNAKSVIGKEISLTRSTSDSGVVKLKPITIKAKIVGIIDGRLDDFDTCMVMPDKMANTIRSYYTLTDNYIKKNGYENVMLHAKDEGNVSYVCNHLKKLDYMNQSREAVAQEIDGYFKIIERVLASLGIIVLFVASLGIINTMVMAINERTKSIGIMKALGASQSDINKTFLFESGMIGFIGGMFGLLLSLAIAKIADIVIVSLMKKNGVAQVMHVGIPLWLIGLSLAVSIGIAIISGLYPASKAAALDPVEALSSK